MNIERVTVGDSGMEYLGQGVFFFKVTAKVCLKRHQVPEGGLKTNECCIRAFMQVGTLSMLGKMLPYLFDKRNL